MQMANGPLQRSATAAAVAALPLGFYVKSRSITRAGGGTGEPAGGQGAMEAEGRQAMAASPSKTSLPQQLQTLRLPRPLLL